MLPNLSDLYRNMSAAGRELQAMLIKYIAETLERHYPQEESFLYQNLHMLIFAEMVDTPFQRCVFFMGDKINRKLLADYAEQIKPESIFVLAEEEMGVTGKLESDTYHMIILPYRALQEQYAEILFELQECLAFEGKVILYGAPERIPILFQYVWIGDYQIAENLTIKELQINKEYIQGSISVNMMQELNVIREKVGEELLGNRIPEKAALDAAIHRIQQLENKVQKHREEIRDIDLKFKVNQLKNALLDLYFCTPGDIPFFKNVVREKMEEL